MANFDASSVNSLETPSRPSWRKRAAEVTDPVLKKSLVVAAERWKRLAADSIGKRVTGTPANFLASAPMRLLAVQR